MIPDWRRLLPWRREAAGDTMPPEDTKIEERKEPAFPRQEDIESPGMEREGTQRMEFLLSLRRRGIGDAAVLRAMDTVPREDFMLPPFAVTAYADQAAPIDCGQTISQPYVVAYMTEQLALKRDHRVLEIGTGSGYQAAILSQLAGLVFSVERYRTLADKARATLAKLGYDNVTVTAGDGLKGQPEHAPYDRIIVTAAAEDIPEALVDQLADGGVMLLPLGQHDGVQRLVKLTRTGEGTSRQDLIAVRFVPLLAGQAREL